MSVNVNDNGILRKIAGGTLYADLPIGAEIMYEGTAVPSGYLACNGSTFSQSEYPDLYAVLGSTTLPNRSGYIIRAKYNVLPLDFNRLVPRVLWTNPDPSADFAQTAVTLSSSDWDFLIITHISGSTTIDRSAIGHYATISATFAFQSRMIIDTRQNLIAESSITFNDAYRIQQTQSGSTVTTTMNNSLCIPTAVYGIKIS